MNWEAIGAIGEVLGAVGVLVTLVYLAIQIRSNTVETHNSTIESVMTADATLRNSLVSGPVPRLMVAAAAGDDITKEERMALTYFMQAYMQGWEVAFYLNTRGSLPDDVLAAIAFRRMATLDTLETVVPWATSSAGYTSDFQSHVAEQLVEFNSKPKLWEVLGEAQQSRPTLGNVS
ncbi:MAG: hypothetical protein ACJAX5_001904 [Patiriisocius sp.]|jgi:hypothetical protein